MMVNNSSSNKQKNNYLQPQTTKHKNIRLMTIEIQVMATNMVDLNRLMGFQITRFSVFWIIGSPKYIYTNKQKPAHARFYSKWQHFITTMNYNKHMDSIIAV